MDDVIRIEALENGFEVECMDPKIAAANAKPKSMWQDPYKGYAFSTVEEAVKFVGERLKTMKPKSKDGGFGDAFKQATKS